MSKLGRRLREERKRLGMSQEGFAREGGVALNTQFNYETGLRNPDTDYLLKIRDSGADAVYILTGQKVAEYLADDEWGLVQAYRAMDQVGKAGILGLVRGVQAQQQKSEREPARKKETPPPSPPSPPSKRTKPRAPARASARNKKDSD